MKQLLLFPLLLLLAAGGTTTDADITLPNVAAPVPTRWPEQFHAVLLTNLTEESGGRLELIDVYYDWPRGRTLNVVRGQLAGEPVFNVEWVNGSSYLFDDGSASSSSSCTATWHPVGILPPDWVDGAAYLGREAVDGFDCHVWSHRFFMRYYQDVATGRPVFWDFTGSRRHVLSFEVGVVPQEYSSKWQAPAYCFDVGNKDAGDAVNGHGNEARAMNRTNRFAGAAETLEQ